MPMPPGCRFASAWLMPMPIAAAGGASFAMLKSHACCASAAAPMRRRYE